MSVKLTCCKCGKSQVFPDISTANTYGWVLARYSTFDGDLCDSCEY